MKKIILAAISALFVCSESNAMHAPMVEEAQRQNITAKYHVATVPPVDVVQSNGRVQLGFMSATGIQMDCQTYNGIKVLQPIMINGSMTKEEMVAALTASFGKPVTVQ